MNENVKNYTLIFMVAFSCITDIRRGRVKNYVTIPSATLGLILALSTGEIQVINDSLFGLLLPFALLFPVFAAGVLGAGDIKLLCGIGSLMGKGFVLRCMLYSAIVGGIMALLLMLYRKNLKARLRYLYNYIASVFLHRHPEVYSFNRGGEDKLPLALAIGLGVIVTVLVK